MTKGPLGPSLHTRALSVLLIKAVEASSSWYPFASLSDYTYIPPVNQTLSDYAFPHSLCATCLVQTTTSCRLLTATVPTPSIPQPTKPRRFRHQLKLPDALHHPATINGHLSLLLSHFPPPPFNQRRRRNHLMSYANQPFCPRYQASRARRQCVPCAPLTSAYNRIHNHP